MNQSVYHKYQASMNAKRSAIVALCSVTFLQAYLLVGVFPYAAFMAINFLHISEEQAGPYAGEL